MDENLVKKLIEDLDRISKKIEEIQARLKVEKKEQRKLGQILMRSEGVCWTHDDLARVAIDAVIECYEQWRKDDGAMMGNKSFPEYLKEKML